MEQDKLLVHKGSFIVFKSIAVYSGLIATIWIFIGIYVAGRFYAGYDHSKQFCSELGATGSPTEKLSPLSVGDKVKFNAITKEEFLSQGGII